MRTLLAQLLIWLLIFSSFASPLARAGDSFEIERKKYVRQPAPPTRPRHAAAQTTRVQTPPESTSKSSPSKPASRSDAATKSDNDSEMKPNGPLIKKRQDDDKGPEIRIALATDTSSATVSSSQPIAYFSSKDEDMVALSTRQVKVQLANSRVRERPGHIYRVQVASLRSSSEADQLVQQLRKRFAEPVESRFDREASQYDITVGEFYSQNEAQAFMVHVMNAGYKKTWVAKYDGDNATAYSAKLIKAISANGEPLVAVRERLTLASQDEENAPLRFNGVTYRGRIEMLVNKRGQLSVINMLSMEDYVRGVVPNELSPGGFPQLEALKAQAVAARTYAIRNLGQFEEEGYDLLPTALSQVYGGMSSEHPLSDRAVRETAGIVATYDGKPINALYTSTCGGRTESSEFVFNEAVPYLVSVACQPQRRARRVEDGKNKDNKAKDSYEPHLLKTVRKPEAVLSESGRAITREIATLDIMQFSLPNDAPASYFLASANEKELVKWVTRAAELIGRHSEVGAGKDTASLAGFASLLANALYGEDRPSVLLSPADADYLLGADAADIPARYRAEVAALLQDGILTPGADGSLHARTAITRGSALLAIARALAKLGQPALESGTARPLENRRLKIRGAKNKDPLEYDLTNDCYIFRIVNNEAFPAASVEVIGGEKVNYHLDSRGRIDYLEVQPNANGAASDRFSAYSRWQVRFTAAEVKARLADAHVQVGDIIDLEGTKYGYSHRLAEMKVIGSAGERTLTGLRIRSALGLRESLFVILREYDANGRINAFQFIGRGWGHGVGMCQVGAYGLALEGLNYQEILKTYYSGIDLNKMY